MVTPGFLPSRDTRTSLYIVGKGREQERKLSESNNYLGIPKISLKSGK
jgi:hypothetical protein